MRRFFLWWVLLPKRLLRRGGYLAVLLAVPLLALLLSLASRQESGLVTVALWRENPLDQSSAAAVQRLTEDPGVLRCYESQSEAAARADVLSGKADAAWLFHPDADTVIGNFDALGPAAVTVVEREDNVLLMLSRERLAAALYPELSYSVFVRFLREIDPALSASDAELEGYYRTDEIAEEAVLLSYAEGGAAAEGTWLTAPLRGLLALLILLAAFASGLYCFRETESFVWLPARRRRLLPLLCHLIAMLPVALAVEAALALAGLLHGGAAEAAAMGLYLLSCALFCELLRALFPSEAGFAALLPPLLIAALLLCPVFLDLRRLRPLQLLFPTFYYLKAALDPSWLPRQAGYALVLALLNLPLGRRERA